MNFVSKPEEPASPSAIYIAARREWNERYGDYIAQARNWRTVALAAIGGMCVSVAAIAWMGVHSRVEPFIVEVNKLGDALAVSRADVAPPIPQAIIRADIARWITGSVSVHARRQFRGRFCWGMVAPGRGSTSDGMRRLRWGSDFGAA